MKEQRLLKIHHTKKGQKLLFDIYFDKMYVVAFRYLRVREDAEDALSEAFVRVFRRVSTFEYTGAGSLQRWIKTIVINESLRILAKKKELVLHEDVDDSDLEYSSQVEGDIDMQFFMQVVDSLPEGYRVVFIMFVVEGYSHKEIAEILNISVSTSKSQLFKARLCVAKKLKNIELYETRRN